MTDQIVANVVARYKKACGCHAEAGVQQQQEVDVHGVHDEGQQGGITRPTPLATEQQVAVAPPGWEGPVKEMKKDKDIDNPWALAWYMKNKGDTPHKASDRSRFRAAYAQMRREASR